MLKDLGRNRNEKSEKGREGGREGKRGRERERERERVCAIEKKEVFIMFYVGYESMIT